MARVIPLPVAMQDAALLLEPPVERGTRVGRERMERGCLDATRYGPLHRCVKDALVVLVQAEDEAAIDHHAQLVEAAHGQVVVVTDVVDLASLAERVGVQRLKANEQAAKSGRSRPLNQPRTQDGRDCASGLPQSAHAAQPVAERLGKARIGKEVVVEKVQMTARQRLDLRKRAIDRLSVESAAAGEEDRLVAEVAGVRTATRDDDGVRHEIEASANEISARPGRADERAAARAIDLLWASGAVVGEKRWPCVFAGTEADRVGVRLSLARE